MKAIGNSQERWRRETAKYDVPHLRLRLVAQIVNRLGVAAVTDLGCAKGTLKKLLRGDVRYSGCDFVEPGAEPGFPWFHCDFNRESLPLEFRNTELFVCSGLLEYIEDVSGFLLQIHSLLHQRGKLVMTYFNKNHMVRVWRKLTGRELYFHPEWCELHSVKRLKGILRTTGFTILQIYPVSQSCSHSAPVGETVREEGILIPYRFYSPLVAHQFLFLCEKSVSDPRS